MPQEPGRLPSMGSHRVGHERATNTNMHAPFNFNVLKLLTILVIKIANNIELLIILMLLI